MRNKRDFRKFHTFWLLGLSVTQQWFSSIYKLESLGDLKKTLLFQLFLQNSGSVKVCWWSGLSIAALWEAPRCERSKDYVLVVQQRYPTWERCVMKYYLKEAILWKSINVKAMVPFRLQEQYRKLRCCQIFNTFTVKVISA